MPENPTPPGSPAPGTQPADRTEPAEPPRTPWQKRLWRAKFLVPAVVCVAFEVQYNILGAISYDWSSFPVLNDNSAGATWQEPLATDGETPGRVATGVDTSTQHTDGILTFIAGAFVGIAGGALLAAVTVALDPKD